MALPEQTLAIAVIGVSGSGKSTFINVASGSNLPVRIPSGSGTTELKSSSFTLDGQPVVLIDTPGFDDRTLSVLEVLKLISDHFSGLYTRGVRLAGVVYMHCITEDHLRGPSRHNFLTFSKFCGDTSLKDVLIVTNKWPSKESIDGEAREYKSAYKDKFFGPAMENGARMLCYDGTRASAHSILRLLLCRARTVLHSPSDLSGRNLDPGCTAGSTSSMRELTGKVERHTKAFEELRQGIDAAALVDDEKRKEILQGETKSSLDEIERIRYDLEQMVTNFATENYRLEEENRRYKGNSSVQRAESELRARLLQEERRARELAEAKREQAEARLADERALWERQTRERESLRDQVGPTYDKLVACGALIFALFCVSRFALEGSALV